MPDTAVARLASLLDRTATDPDQDPSDRLVALRVLRDDIAALVGQADRYIADQDTVREGAAMNRVADFLAARENAGVRSSILAAGTATPEQLDAAGYASDDELDGRTEDGTVEEAIMGAAEAVEARLREARSRMDRDWALNEADTDAPASQPSTADVFSRVIDGRRVYDESRRSLHQRILAARGELDDVVLEIPEYRQLAESEDPEARDVVLVEATDLIEALGDEGIEYADFPDVVDFGNWRVQQLAFLRGRYGELSSHLADQDIASDAVEESHRDDAPGTEGDDNDGERDD